MLGYLSWYCLAPLVGALSLVFSWSDMATDAFLASVDFNVCEVNFSCLQSEQDSDSPLRKWNFKFFVLQFVDLLQVSNNSNGPELHLVCLGMRT